MTPASARRLSIWGRFLAAYILATVTALAVHWALPFTWAPVTALAWLVVIVFAGMSSRREVALIILTLPLGFLTELFFVWNLQSCGHWVC